MIIPKKLNIAGKEIAIRINHIEAQTERAYGMCFYDQNKILLDDYKVGGISESKIEQTLLHEVLHYCNTILGKHNADCNNEDYVNALSELLYQVIPQLTKEVKK